MSHPVSDHISDSDVGTASGVDLRTYTVPLKFEPQTNVSGQN